jgi:hypothetical protein
VKYTSVAVTNIFGLPRDSVILVIGMVAIIPTIYTFSEEWAAAVARVGR